MLHVRRLSDQHIHKTVRRDFLVRLGLHLLHHRVPERDEQARQFPVDAFQRFPRRVDLRRGRHTLRGHLRLPARGLVALRAVPVRESRSDLRGMRSLRVVLRLLRLYSPCVSDIRHPSAGMGVKDVPVPPCPPPTRSTGRG